MTREMKSLEVIKISSIETPNGISDRQGYIVYDSNGISVSLTSQGGGLGRYAGLYLVKRNGNG